MSKRTWTILTDVAVVILLAIGVFQIEKTSVKILRTAVELVVIHDNIQVYNENPRKTDEWTEDVEYWIQLRSEEYYNSKDFVVRTYSNANVFLKILAIPVALLIMLAMPILTIRHILECLIDRNWIETLERKVKREKRYNSSSDKFIDELMSWFLN